VRTQGGGPYLNIVLWAQGVAVLGNEVGDPGGEGADRAVRHLLGAGRGEGGCRCGQRCGAALAMESEDLAKSMGAKLLVCVCALARVHVCV